LNKFTNKLAYAVISEEVAKSNLDHSIIVKPLIVGYTSIPGNFKFSIAAGLLLDNGSLKSVLMKIKNPNGEVLTDVDLMQMYLNSTDYIDLEGIRRDYEVSIDIGLSHNQGISVESEGIYKIEFVVNGDSLGGTFIKILDEEKRI